MRAAILLQLDGVGRFSVVADLRCSVSEVRLLVRAKGAYCQMLCQMLFSSSGRNLWLVAQFRRQHRI